MKKILFAWGIFLSSYSQAQTIDVSQLNEVDKQKHRLAYCSALERWNQWELDFLFDAGPIFDIMTLLDDSGFVKRVGDPFMNKAENDTKAKLILGEIKLNQIVFNNCINDLKKILKKEYVPNFSYMEK